MNTSTATAAARRRAMIVDEARAWIGTPYRHQASLRGVGADCLGLVRGVWREVIGPEPETPPAYAPDWAEASGAELLARAAGKHFLPQESKACRAGDLLLFRWRTNLPAKHLGIATGPQTMVHAHEGACVCEVALSRWWKRRLVAVFSFPSASDVSR